VSEGQFAYSGFTLDELRSLASSPQVGTMQAMPQSFRALAERVGEVADLLTHAQADLPNWWKGPAAEQAAATLGRAAGEAREFHDSAMGAATAVDRCAQVVAEQQHQMMNVPEVPEPGITDVVQRPTTPFEALEAARQDARYQAAHEQAVQVVNGIAAQYVETRGQLSNVVFKFGENFTPMKESNPPALNTEIPHNANYRIAASPTRSQQSSEPLYLPSKIDTNDHAANPIKDRTLIPKEATSSRSLESELAGPSPFNPTLQKNAAHETFEHDTGDSTFTLPDFPTPPETSRTVRNAKDETPDATSNTPLSIKDIPPESPRMGFFSTTTKASAAQGAHAVLIEDRPGNAKGIPTSSQIPRTQVSEDQSIDPIESTSNSPASDSPQATYEPQSDGTNSENAEIVPPYSSLGSVHRTREGRSPRPAYLKERKSAWLPDTVAAPADGVIGPDWFERL
jgi:hypothetical protein